MINLKIKDDQKRSTKQLGKKTLTVPCEIVALVEHLARAMVRSGM